VKSAIAIPLALVVLVAIVLGGIALAGGGDDDESPNPSRLDAIETPAETTTPRSDPGLLPPAFIECMAEQGFDVNSPDDIHAAPPQVLQTCFATLHQGGGGPSG
jgi:hypothetical protein